MIAPFSLATSTSQLPFKALAVNRPLILRSDDPKVELCTRCYLEVWEV